MSGPRPYGQPPSMGRLRAGHAPPLPADNIKIIPFYYRTKSVHLQPSARKNGAKAAPHAACSRAGDQAALAGLVLGSTTAGKGVLLSDPQSLSDGSAVVITVGILLDNEGKNWNGTGLTPDVDASLTNDEQSSYYDFTVDNDPQITKAINAISGANGQ